MLLKCQKLLYWWGVEHIFFLLKINLLKQNKVRLMKLPSTVKE